MLINDDGIGAWSCGVRAVEQSGDDCLNPQMAGRYSATPEERSKAR